MMQTHPVRLAGFNGRAEGPMPEKTSKNPAETFVWTAFGEDLDEDAQVVAAKLLEMQDIPDGIPLQLYRDGQEEALLVDIRNVEVSDEGSVIVTLRWRLGNTAGLVE